MKKYAAAVVAASLTFAANAADMPAFPGGEQAMLDFISANISYPSTALENGVEGVVHVGFTVAPDGSIKGAKVLRPIDPDLEQEAIRVVESMPAWTPADKDGKPVAAPAQVAITFTLPG